MTTPEKVWDRVRTTNTGIGNTRDLINNIARKLGIAIPLPGPTQEADLLVSLIKANNQHADQGDWCRQQILEILSRPFG